MLPAELELLDEVAELELAADDCEEVELEPPPQPATASASATSAAAASRL